MKPRLFNLFSALWLPILLLSGCIVAIEDIPIDDDASLTIWNDTSYVILEMYVSPSYINHWGPDLLGRDVLYPGDEATVYDLACDDYDVLLVDEDEWECELSDVSLCFFDEVWRITDSTLAYCYN